MAGNGGCEAHPLPGDPTCAGIARRSYRRAAASLSLDPALIDDGVTIVSELAANTLHVRGNHLRAGPELWLYLRGSGASRELVCKVFDAYPGWLDGAPGGRFGVPSDAVSGRGLAVVHELSGGHWGYHLTRARLGGWHVRGKAVWFALPAPAPEADAASTRPAGVIPAASEAMTELEAGLVARGFGGTRFGGTGRGNPDPRNTDRLGGTGFGSTSLGSTGRGITGSTLVRADDRAADMAVLSVCNGVTVWCRGGAAWLRAPGMSGRRWGYGDLTELTEQTVEAYETVTGGAELPQLIGAGA